MYLHGYYLYIRLEVLGILGKCEYISQININSSIVRINLEIKRKFYLIFLMKFPIMPCDFSRLNETFCRPTSVYCVAATY